MKKKALIALLLSMVMVAGVPQNVGATMLSANDVSEMQTDELHLESEADQDDNEQREQEESVRKHLKDILDEKDIYLLLYNTKEYALHSQPNEEGENMQIFPCGSQMQLKDVEFSDNGNVYYLVEAYLYDTKYTGYVERSYVVTEDPDFLKWKDEELSQISGLEMQLEISKEDSIRQTFPQGYHAYLIALNAKHPNWTFVPYNTGLDGNTVLNEEHVGNRSLVYKTSDDSWKSKEAGDYDAATGTYVGKSGANWYRASIEGISYCMNPLNYLSEKNIFAFEQLTLNRQIQNVEGIKAIISNTWMKDTALEDGSGGLYADVFMQVGEQTGISPYHLASRVVQEQGIMGQAPLISGYGGVYNYFNVKASGGTEQAILATGTAYAQQQGWTTRYLSILGGATRLGENYITKGQDSLYLQKYDVDSSFNGLYTHQYMQNIQAPLTESEKVYRAYNSAGALDSSFVFKIPTYDNMPGVGAIPVTPTVDKGTAEAFVKRLYKVILNRDADETGLNTWIKALTQEGKTAGDLIYGFFYSDEMLNKNLGNSEFLDYAYRAILGREADAGGKESWLKEMQAGATRGSIINGFVGSDEFTSMCKQYGITRGDLPNMEPADKNINATKFVVRLYRNILGRDADPTGLNTWTKDLISGKPACPVVEGFFYSNEFQNAGYSNDQFVEILYRTILGRESDAAGKADWVGRLNAGESKSRILAGFVYSNEFRELCAQYGIRVGELTR